jgi:HEPN domain-containing protein
MAEPVLVAARGWLLKAEHDLASARKLASEPDPYLDTAIYHCQQAAEKALKGWLTYRGVRFDRTHDVRHLVAHAAEHEPAFRHLAEAGQVLTPYASAYRYPDEVLEPDPEEFEEALQHAASVYGFVLSLLPPGARP